MFDYAADRDGEVPVDGLALGEIREARQRVLWMRIAQTNFPADQRVPAEDRAKQRAFARSVGTENRRRTSAHDIERQILQGGCWAVTHADVAESKDVMRRVAQRADKQISKVVKRRAYVEPSSDAVGWR